MSTNSEVIRKALNKFVLPYANITLSLLQALGEITVTGGMAAIELKLNFPALNIKSQLEQQLLQHLQQQGLELEKVELQLAATPLSHKVQNDLKPLPQIKNIIAVASGKGGVGKSTVSVNLAAALYLAGAKVGILDADIYGPSQPMMLGQSQKPTTVDNKSFEPIMSHGLQSMSIGYLLDDDDTPLIWRGPMVTSALVQLLNDTRWRSLDYLIIDLPPGTGDIQLTLAQKIPVSGAVIVSTPQDIALSDAKKAVTMFNKVKVPVLGVVENMSTHVCSSCGHEDDIFGKDGVAAMAERYNLRVLGQLPLSKTVRQAADNGKPVVLQVPQDKVSQQYVEIAYNIAAQLSLQPQFQYQNIAKVVVAEN